MEGRYYRKHWPEYEDLGWNYYGCPTAIDTQSNWRKESSSSGPTDSVLERKWRCSSPVKLVSLCLTIILLALICGIIYLSHLKDQNIRYYTSEGSLTINQAYTSNLRNTNSEEYSLFTYTFCAQMERTFKSNSSPYGSTYQSCDVQSLTPGSIIVTFTLYFLDTITVTNEEVISVITSSISVVNSNTVFGDFIVDTSTLSVTTTLQVYEQDPLPEIKSINLPSTSTTSTSYPSSKMVTTSSTKTTRASTIQTTSTASLSTEMVTSSTKTTEASTTQTTSTTSPSTEMVTTSSIKTTEASTTQTTSTTSPSTEMVTTSSTKTEVSTTQKTSTTDAPTSTQSTIVQTTASVLTTDKMTANPATTISTTDEATSMQSTAFQTTSSASTTDKMTSNPLSTITSPTQSLKNETTSAVSKAVENITKISTTEESMSTQLPTVESTQTLSKSSTTIESTTTDLTSKASSTMSNTVQSTLESSTTHKSTSAHLPTVESTVESTSKPLTTVEITTTQLPEVESTSTTPTTTETTPEQSTSSKTTLAPLITVEAISTNSPMVTPTSSGSNSTESTTMESTEQNSTASTKVINTPETLKTVEATSVTPLTVKTTSDSLQTEGISTASSTTDMDTSFKSTAPKTTASQTTTIGASTEDSATVISENTSSSLSAVQTTTEILTTATVESTPTLQSTSQISMSSSTETITTELSSTEHSISPSADTTMETKSTSTTETLIMTTPTSDKTTENITSTQNVSTTESSTTDIHNTTSTSTSSTYGKTTMYNTTSTPVSTTYVDTTIYNTTTTLDSSSTYVNITMYNITSTTESSTYVNPTIYDTTSTTESSTFENTINYNITSSTMLPSTDTSMDYTSLSTSDPTQRITSSYLRTADISFPSATVFAKVDTTLVCTIKVEDNWSIITAGQELDSDVSVLAEYFTNGTVSEKTMNDLTTVTFAGNNETITVAFNVHLSSVAVCPSLLHLTCGIKMMDFAESSITNVSVVHITAPVSNVTLDMSPSFYTGERLELTCRTKTDFDYGDVTLEVQFPDGSRLQEPAMRSKYSTVRNADCTVNFEWIFKSDFSLEQNMNGSIIRCVASNGLLNDIVITSRVLILLTSDVSFVQYYVSAKPGDQVSIACRTNIAVPSIQNISIYKLSNNTNVTITTYSNGMVTNSPGTTGLGNFQNGTLTVEFTSLQCSDEAQYFCTVTYGSNQITSTLFLTLQPTTLAGSTSVSLSLSVNIVEKSFHHLSEHICSGEIGYPEVNGFLSLTFTNPKTKELFTFNEKVTINSTKIIVTGISLNKVILADGLILLIREDAKLNESCSTTQRMRFYLNVTNQWNHGQIKCEIQTEDGPVLSSKKEEVFFVIPADACADFNGTGTVFIDHEKVDQCKTYIQCEKYQPPSGSRCSNIDQCAYIGKNYCDDCSVAACNESPTTSALTTPSLTIPTTTGSTGNKYLECVSVSVYLGESANIKCNLNISNFLSLNVSKSGSTLLSVQSDGTVIISSSYSGRLSAVFLRSSLTLDITIQSTSCEDDGLYSVTMEFDRTESYMTSFTVTLKVKPGTPTLTLHSNLIDGENVRSHVCTGDVGHPPGKLEIEIKRSGDTDFSIYHPAGQTGMYSEVAGNCSSTQTLDFSIDLSSDSWINVTVRCIALNSVALNSTDEPPSSKEYTVSSVPGDYCTNKTATYYEKHPMGCPFYVWCVNGRTFSEKCATQELCFDIEKGYCIRI